MQRSLVFGLATALATISLGADAVNRPRHTQQCGTTLQEFVQVYGDTSQVREVARRVADGDPLFWNPTATEYREYGPRLPDRASLKLMYAPLQHLWEIGRPIQAALATRGLSVTVDGIVCTATLTWPQPRTLVAHELRHVETGAYRLAIGYDERRTLLSDSVWQPTGETFLVPDPDDHYLNACIGMSRIARLSLIDAADPGVEVLTGDPVECGSLRASGAWHVRDVPFHAWSGFCPRVSLPVVRLFNGSASGPNHRYVIRAGLRREMEAAGWIAEGTAFCVPDPALRWLQFY